MYLIDITLDTLVRVTLEAGAILTSLPVTDRNAIMDGNPVSVRTILNHLQSSDVAKMTLILPEGTGIEVEQPRKFTLPLISDFVAAQAAKKGGD